MPWTRGGSSRGARSAGPWPVVGCGGPVQALAPLPLFPRGEVTYRGAKAFLVEMRPASALLRLLVDPIELIYSPQGRLLEFRGLANVLDEEGDRYEARIVFDYPSSGPSAAQVGAAE